MARIKLCILSTAAGGSYVDRHGRTAAVCDRQACPLGLTHAQARRYPCKTRRDIGEVQDRYRRFVRVQALECLFPRTWNGDTIRNPKAFARSIKSRT